MKIKHNTDEIIMHEISTLMKYQNLLIVRISYVLGRNTWDCTVILACFKKWRYRLAWIVL
jgi:hypothetical protein